MLVKCGQWKVFTAKLLKLKKEKWEITGALLWIFSSDQNMPTWIGTLVTN